MFSTNASQVSTAANYIEDVFSTYLYTGDGSTSQAVQNNIDLSKGGLVWEKARNLNDNNYLSFANTTGSSNKVNSNTTTAQTTNGGVTFATNGYTLNSTYGAWGVGATVASWTFRKQAKFFDVVTYTGTGSTRTIAHNLGSVPGCIIVKRTDTTGAWQVYHRSLNFSGGTAEQSRIVLNTTAAQTEATFGYWNRTAPTSTVFYLGGDDTVNASGGTYVAYLFAHNAGGFGLTGNDNVISCGSYEGTGADNNAITLGYEPQFLMIKRASGGLGGWIMCDVMRGIATPTAYDTPATVNSLQAESSSAESFAFTFGVTATGFNLRESNTQVNANGDIYIYIAIRRGPMKVPTSGTSVFTPVSTTPNADNFAVSTNNLVDMIWSQKTTSTGGDNESYDFDRLRGCSVSSQPFLKLSSTIQEVTQAGQGMGIAQNTGYIDNWFYWNYGGGKTIANWTFSRAPGFFDEVCYTGTGSATTFSHNLGVVPEFMIVKRRDSINSWLCYQSALGNDRQISLNLSSAVGGSSITPWNSTTPTNSVFSVGTNAGTNASGGTYVNYLFATCPGVSKVGSYTGTGATQTINCGFTGGARFVLIKRTDSTGDWYVWDTARGMVAGTDPYLLLNVQSSQVNTNSVYTTGVGFQIVSTAAGINASGGSYIYLAVS